MVEVQTKIQRLEPMSHSPPPRKTWAHVRKKTPIFCLSFRLCTIENHNWCEQNVSSFSLPLCSCRYLTTRRTLTKHCWFWTEPKTPPRWISDWVQTGLVLKSDYLLGTGPFVASNGMFRPICKVLLWLFLDKGLFTSRAITTAITIKFY